MTVVVEVVEWRFSLDNHCKYKKKPVVHNVEGIFCKAYYEETRYVIEAVYRPPNSTTDALDDLHNYLVAHVKPQDRIILAGYFNLPIVNWPSFSLQQSNYKICEIIVI